MTFGEQLVIGVAMSNLAFLLWKSNERFLAIGQGIIAGMFMVIGFIRMVLWAL